MRRLEHDENVTVHCTDKDKTMTVEVVMFQPKKFLNVNIVGNDIHMRYSDKHDVYVGSSAGLEFTTKGPEYWYI